MLDEDTSDALNTSAMQVASRERWNSGHVFEQQRYPNRFNIGS